MQVDAEPILSVNQVGSLMEELMRVGPWAEGPEVGTARLQ